MGECMKYIFNKNKIRKKFEAEMKYMLDGEKYRIQGIESFADFSDSLSPFKECAILLGTPIIPISFSMCERSNKLLGVDTLSFHKSEYDSAKYEWAKKSCVNDVISGEEYYNMLRKIQMATLPYGAFTIAFKCHRMDDAKVKSNYSDSEIYYAPLLYDPIEMDKDILDYFCYMHAGNVVKNGNTDICQMNVYTDNILKEEDIDEVYPVIKKMMAIYNEYVTVLYHTYKDSRIYQHRCDFP